MHPIYCGSYVEETEILGISRIGGQLRCAGLAEDI